MFHLDFINFVSIFRFSALAGTWMFAFQLLLTVLGTDHDYHETNHGGGSTEDGKFKWMSRQALTGFLMMFGWAGLACHEQFHLSILTTLLISIGAGLIAAVMTVMIFRMAMKMHSSGTVFRVEDAVGKEATVYHRIPKNGAGKITISLHDFTHEIDAISPDEEEIPSFTSVQVIKKADDKTVIVVPLK